MDNEDRPRRPARIAEWQAWVCCLAGAVMPTVVLAKIVETFERTWPFFVPTLYIGLFNLMVIAVRPWSSR